MGPSDCGEGSLKGGKACGKGSTPVDPATGSGLEVQTVFSVGTCQMRSGYEVFSGFSVEAADGVSARGADWVPCRRHRLDRDAVDITGSSGAEGRA